MTETVLILGANGRMGRNAAAGNQAVGVDNGRYPSVPLYTVSVGVQF